VPYRALYRVVEGDATTHKEVWRSGREGRVEYASPEGNTISLYFLEGGQYSCSSLSGGPRCYNVTGRVGKDAALFLFLDSPPPGSEYEGDVQIGGEKGSCYAARYGLGSSRRSCFTGRGVLAYDEMNSTGRQSRVEYATLIEYEVREGEVSLPAAPILPPG
jgi:hypothetical protein